MFPAELSCLDVMAKRQKAFGVVKKIQFRLPSKGLQIE